MKFTRGIYIDGDYFDIPIESLKRSADFLDKYANRVESGELERDLIGVYYNYTLTAGKSSEIGEAEYNRFFDKCTEPKEFHLISVPASGGGYYNFTAYISSVSDEVEKIGKDYIRYKSFTCKFTAKAPARTPT